LFHGKSGREIIGGITNGLPVIAAVARASVLR
jgi:hypothetical protein